MSEQLQTQLQRRSTDQSTSTASFAQVLFFEDYLDSKQSVSLLEPEAKEAMLKRSRSLPTAILIAGSLLVGSGLSAASPQAAVAAPTTTLITGSSAVVAANNVRAVTHPSTTSTGVVASSTDAVATAQAAALANLSGATVILSASTTDPAAVNAVVVNKNITKLTFVGAASAFPASYRNAIDSRVTTKSIALSDSPFTRAKSLVPSGQTEFVVAKTSDVTAMNAALSYSSASGSALIVVTGSEPANSVQAYFSPMSDPGIVLVGDPGVSDQLKAEDADKFSRLKTDTALAIDETYVNISQQHVQKKGRAANKVVTAPGGDLISFALATLVSRSDKSVAIPAGVASAIGTDSPAGRYLTLWKSELQRLTLVGTSTTSSQLSTVATPTTQNRTAAPAWTVTNVTLGSNNHTITYTARSGAVRYAALDGYEEPIATSTTTSLTLPGVPNFTTIAAYNSSNVEIERIFFRSNGYDVAADRETALVGTMRSGSSDLRILGTAGIPRKIVRFSVDPYGVGNPTGEPTTVAITCQTSFAESGLDPQKQWLYEVVNLTLQAGLGCGAAAGATIAPSSLPLSAINLPLTQDPWAGMAARQNEDLSEARVDASDPSALLPRAGQTVSDVGRQKMVEQAADGAAASSGGLQATAASAASGSGFSFIYQGYIPEKVILGPAYSGDPSHPIVYFNGSDRTWYDMNNIHNKFDLQADVYASSFIYNKHIGQTVRIHCSFSPTCYTNSVATASTNQISVAGSMSGSTTTIRYNVATTNPLLSYAPDISGNMTLTLTPQAWTLRGIHDRMPVHQVWWGAQEADAYLAYSSQDFYFPGCLAGAVASPTCVALVNVRL